MFSIGLRFSQLKKKKHLVDETTISSNEEWKVEIIPEIVTKTKKQMMIEEVTHKVSKYCRQRKEQWSDQKI